MAARMHKRSPLKERPLRNPGQSVDEERGRAMDRVVEPVLVIAVAIMFAALEWWRYIANPPPQPWAMTFLALMIGVAGAYRIRRVLRELQRLKLASDGEKLVGQSLETLREKGYRVFHDVIGSDFNIDHVIIGPAGVFTIETKTFRKRPAADATVQFDGNTLTIDRSSPHRDPVTQAKGQAQWLRGLLQESTGRSFPVRPVVLFPGWFVKQTRADSLRHVWVLTSKAFPKFLARERVVQST